MDLLSPFRNLWTGLSVLYYDLLALAFRSHLPWLLCMLPWFLVLVGIFIFAAGSPEFADGVRNSSIHPLFLVGLPIVTALTMALAGPATAALYEATWKFHDEHLDPSWSGFWRSFRSFFWRAWAIATIDICAFYLLILAFFFYWNQGEMPLQVIALIVTYPAIFWFLMQPFLMPALTQLNGSVRATFRNAASLALTSFSMSIGLFLITVLTVVLSLVLNFLVFLVAPTALALSGQLSVSQLIDRINRRTPG